MPTEQDQNFCLKGPFIQGFEHTDSALSQNSFHNAEYSCQYLPLLKRHLLRFTQTYFSKLS